MTSMIHSALISSFCAHSKNGSAATEAAVEVGKKANPTKLFQTRDLAHMAAGAGLLYGGKRLYEDVKMGEEERRRQKAMQRGY